MIQSHHLPTCDDVFEVLTQGPFPTGHHDTDFPVQRHLSVCHSCRELAEALRPATDMLSEGQQDIADGDHSLPVFLAHDVSIENPSAAASKKEHRTDYLATLTGPLIATSVCLMVVLAINSSWQNDGSDGQGHAPGFAAGPSDSGNGQALPQLAGNSLSCSLMAFEAVRRKIGADRKNEARQMAEEFTAAQCCSQCHHAEHEGESHAIPLKRPQMLALVGHCQHCHSE
ncbi:hypothetical protein GC197_12240 [bacterium]|nr:hypothetical protein [bacterium]